MVTSACDLINGYFSLWFDEWRLLSVVWLMPSLACGVMNDDFCLVWLMSSSACALIDGDFCLCFDWWQLLPNGWLIGFITRSGDFYQVSDWWDLSPRNDYSAINWDVILGRMPIIGLIIGSYPRQWYVYRVVSPVSGLIIGSIPHQWLN